MARIESEINVNMRIVSIGKIDPRFKDIAGNEVIRDDPRAFTLAIYLESADGGTSVHYMDFTRQVITKGKFYDKWMANGNTRPPTRVDEALDKLEEIGVPNGLPQELQKVMNEGRTIEVNASIKGREYQQNGVSKRAYEAKYLNAVRGEVPIKDLDFNLLLPETKDRAMKSSTVPIKTVPIKKDEFPEGSEDFNPDALDEESSPM